MKAWTYSGIAGVGTTVSVGVVVDVGGRDIFVGTGVAVFVVTAADSVTDTIEGLQAAKTRLSVRKIKV